MNIKMSDYSKECVCGQKHHTDTKSVLIEKGALLQFRDILRSAGLDPKRGVSVYDRNTYDAVENRPASLKDIILDPAGLHANEHALSQTVQQIDVDLQFMTAVGSGTIHDITRQISCDLGVPFISVPTACSVDGFLSGVSALTLNGCKVTLNSQAPLAVIADTGIFKHAPLRLAISGVGDILGKYTALTDWRIAYCVNGEAYCPSIVKMQFEAIHKVYENCRSLLTGDEKAYETLMYALLLSGLAIQMFGNSRPASACEHHISHFLEMNLINPELDALHGEKVGVGTLLAARKYREILSSDSFFMRRYRGMDESYVREIFGEVSDQIIKTNAQNCFSEHTWQNVCNNRDAISGFIGEIPDTEELAALYHDINAPSTLEDIGIDSKFLETILTASPYVRNRLSLMRILSQTE